MLSTKQYKSLPCQTSGKAKFISTDQPTEPSWKFIQCLLPWLHIMGKEATSKGQKLTWIGWLLLTRSGLKPPLSASRSAELTSTAVTITTNTPELVHRLVVTQPLQGCDMIQLCTQCIWDLVSSSLHHHPLSPEMLHSQCWTAPSHWALRVLHSGGAGQLHSPTPWPWDGPIPSAAGQLPPRGSCGGNCPAALC